MNALAETKTEDNMMELVEALTTETAQHCRMTDITKQVDYIKTRIEQSQAALQLILEIALFKGSDMNSVLASSVERAFRI